MMPLASAEHLGSNPQEATISALLLSLTLAMLLVCLLTLWGLIARPRAS
jgi:hypothetical protein